MTSGVASYYLVYMVGSDAYEGLVRDKDEPPPSPIGEYCVPVSELTMRAFGGGLRVPENIGRAKLHEKFIRDLDSFVTAYPVLKEEAG